MANNYWTDTTSMGTKPARKPPATGFRGGPKGGGTEKPAFPKADLPGKAQSKDRSAGVRRVQNSPKKIGL